MTKIANLPKPRKILDKPRNAGTMTEPAFWAMMRSTLRRKTMTAWKPVLNVLLMARRPHDGTNPRQKWEFQCADCKRWFPRKQVEVDHVTSAGALSCSEDLPGFVDRLFCEEEGLRVVCNQCHDDKTHNRI